MQHRERFPAPALPKCRPKTVGNLTIGLLRPNIERLSLPSKFVRDALNVIHSVLSADLGTDSNGRCF
jgi:hypothetical protein